MKDVDMLPQPATLCQTKPPHASDPGATAGLRSAPPCPRCGYLEVRHYDQEVPICEGCGAVLTDDPPGPGWLDQWPRNRRSGLAQLFYRVIRSGELSPAAIVEQVAAAIHHRLRWGPTTDERQFWYQVLNTMGDDPRGVRAYAESVLAREQLPAAEKARLRAEAARQGVLEAMRGKPVTDKQAWLIRTKGYTGPMPRDRAEASELIDSLLRTGGRG